MLLYPDPGQYLSYDELELMSIQQLVLHSFCTRFVLFSRDQTLADVGDFIDKVSSSYAYELELISSLKLPLLYHFRLGVVMDLTSILKLLVLIILVGYFINQILVAKTKLYDRKIGTLQRKMNSDTVKGGLCYCFHVMYHYVTSTHRHYRKKLYFISVHKCWRVLCTDLEESSWTMRLIT